MVIELWEAIVGAVLDILMALVFAKAAATYMLYRP